MDSKLIDPLMLKALQVTQEQEKLEQQIRSAFFGLDLTQIQEIIRWQETFGQWAETLEINDLVISLSDEENPDLNKASDWLESNKEELTPEKLRMIVYAAMLHGVADYLQKRGDTRHQKNRAKVARIPEHWEKYHAKGMSKNNAAPRIAKDIGLAETTVREKLKGL